MDNYKCCITNELTPPDYFYGTCCYPCTYGYGCYKTLSRTDKDLGFLAGACVVCLSALGSTLVGPFVGCYVRVTRLGQNFGYACLMEVCAPFTCAPCQMAYFGRKTPTDGSLL